MIRVKRERGESSRRVGDEVVEEAEDGEDAQLSARQRARRGLGIDRRTLRFHYRALKSNVNDGKGQLAQLDFVQFKEIIDEAQGLHKLVVKPREQVVDADLFLDITNDLLDVAKGARIKGGMSSIEFVGAIILNFGLSVGGDGSRGPSLDWGSLGLEACAVSRAAPGVSTMVGPMDIEVKQRKAPVNRRRVRPTEKTRPEAVGEVDADRPASETDANMRTMFKVLSERGEIDLDCLILNRNSFAQTTENLFALSFLVKDGRVEYRIDNGRHFLVPRNAPTHDERAGGEGTNTQFVFRLDYDDWQVMQTDVKEGAEVMPHRAPQCHHGSTSTPETGRTPIRKNSRNRARETPLSAPQTDGEEDSGEGSSQDLKRRLTSPFAD